MRYIQIEKGFWYNSPWFRKLSLQKKAFIFYLLTNSQVEYLGYFEKHPEVIAEELHCKVDVVEQTLDFFEDEDIIFRVGYWIYFTHFFEMTHNSAINERTLKALEKNKVLPEKFWEKVYGDVKEIVENRQEKNEEFEDED